MEYVTSIILDTRRAKGKDLDLYPVKLRVYSTQLQLKKLYSTKYNLTKKDFASVWQTEKPRKEHKNLRNEIQAIEMRAIDVCKKLNPFSFTQFEKKYLRNTGDGANIVYQYNQIKERLLSNNSINTASSYELSLKSIKDFIKYTKGKEPLKIPFTDITPDWLQKYENYMINDLKRSQTTVSIYLRALRSVFNTAIRDKEIDAEVYPFGKSKYQPPAVRKVKKALSNEDLKKLFKAKAKTPEQAKAKGFWFLSYACNGMNIKDIALLKFENIEGDKIIFYRAKTINTSKTDLKPITVYLNNYINQIITKYGNKTLNKGDYIFPILTKKDSETNKHTKIKNFTRFINQNLKKLAESKGLAVDISTYWARHSFATNAIRNGASMEYVMEALSHNNLKTTIGYFAGFEDKDKKEFAGKLMDF
ncbi:MAG TPA: phage integrase SAM-like domain-containing protein [Bacteroidia bacterium]|jgi:integrase/recombinase XerD|nr:phage integrase SAM-like domain-containing protein [Bacteroidia bacterium]